MLLSRSPLPRPPGWVRPFDLHVLGAPPAFILSQDRTLRSELGGLSPAAVSVSMSRMPTLDPADLDSLGLN